MSAWIDDWHVLARSEKKALKDAGVMKLEELLVRFPRRYEDRRKNEPLPTHASIDAICTRGLITDARTRGFGRQSYFEIMVVEPMGCDGVFSSHHVICRWFHMPSMNKYLLSGQNISLYGKVKEVKGKLIMDHPEVEVLNDDLHEDASLHMQRIVPVYPNISGIKQRRLREIMHQVIQWMHHTAERIESFSTMGDEPLKQAYQAIHFPEEMSQVSTSRRQFALEELFQLQFKILSKRQQYQQLTGRILGKKTTLLKSFYHSLPFDFTNAQKRVIKEIIVDMRQPIPMNRLLQGDVGAGKTFVAMAAMLMAVDSGCQAALMAPTQILAEQHYLTFQHWLQPLGIRLQLMTGTKKEQDFFSETKAQIIIGTHALLYGHNAFDDLGLVVIDEQHRFGVEQREALVGKGNTPDILAMTATPIPRTLTMSVYGDLDVSILDEKPFGRGEIETKVMISPKIKELDSILKSPLEQGRQVYLIYPLVEENEQSTAEAVVQAYEKWQTRLKGYRVGMVHGKLKATEKDQIMRLFHAGEIQVLVSTTVVEVGVDVPNATLMMIFHAERFGLAQLHQLRGRIGRGKENSFCFLMTDGKSSESLEKLNLLASTQDGFEIAEYDLRLRGPGDVLGKVQSGMHHLKFIEFLTDLDLIKKAKSMASDRLNRKA